jgi:guanosine-3',5'-bis(diphosphate) 3'-pyrophosphohydrolase
VTGLNYPRTRGFAVWAHGIQTYGDGQPYSVHLDAVAAVAESLGASENVRHAAYLHDVVEDTGIPISVIEDLFGSAIAKLVAAVTNERGANRAERHARTYPKTRAAGPDAVLLKLCDRIANVRACGPGGAPRLLPMYAKEHPGFRGALWLPGEHETAWSMLHAAFVDVGAFPNLPARP